MKLINFVDFMGNIIWKKLKLYKFLKPKILTIIFTGKCNAMCVMCNIWKEKREYIDITLDEYKRIFSNSKQLKNISIVNITGGEIFLRKDLVELVTFLVNNTKKLEEIRFASNGLLPDQIEKDIKELVKLPARFNIKISIDGIGETHNKIRGRKDAFELAEKTIDKLRRISKEHKNFDLAIAHTIMPENYKETLDIYERYTKKDIDCMFKIVYSAAALHNIGSKFNFSIKEKDIIIDNLHKIYCLETKKIDAMKRSYKKLKRIAYLLFIKYEINLQRNPHKSILPCHSTFSSVTIESDGKVYSCGIIYGFLGDLKQKNFDDIWLDKKNAKLRNFIRAKKCKCSNTCDTIPSLMLNNSIEVIWRFLK